MQINIPDREKLRIIGLYLIIILAILIFVILPLNNFAKEKKTLLTGQLESYATKAMLLQRKKQADEIANKSASEQEKKLIASLYQKGSRVSEMQLETLKTVIKSINENGLSMINFQLPEPAISRGISEIPILITIQGKPNAVINLFKEVNEMKMLTDVKDLRLSGSKSLFKLTLTLVVYRNEF